MKSDKSIFTKVVHAGEDLTQNHGAVSVPIYNASLFAFENADEGAAIHNFEKEGYFYGKLGNPTQNALEDTIAELENGESAITFASGMAATSSAILALVKTGDHIVAPESMYSTTTLFLHHLAENFGIELSLVNATNAENYRNAIQPNTKLFWIETPSNPRLNIIDISAVANIAKENGISTIADNTFATPYNQKPLDLGADLVMHSATKYLGGHSDLTAGLLIGKNKEFVDKIRHSTSKLLGGSISPQVAWLILRGIKTLALRMRQHNENAYAIANMLADHPKVTAVFYPSLKDHQNHEIAKKQMNGFGGMIAFDVGGIEEGKNLVNNVELCTLATSLGGVETILQHSASMTHATLSPEARLKAGVTDGMIRLSVGIEDADDLIEDLQNALEKI
jgi:methionine-gamma-lyase